MPHFRLVLFSVLLLFVSITQAQDSIEVVHAQKDYPILSVPWADTIRIPTNLVPDSIPFSIVAKPAGKVGTVVFSDYKDGRPVVLRVEGTKPYSLFGDTKGKYNPYPWPRNAGYGFPLLTTVWEGIRSFSPFRELKTYIAFVNPPKPPDPPDPKPDPELGNPTIVVPIVLGDGETIQIKIEIIRSKPPN